MRKKREAAASNPGGNGSTDGGMPEMRRSDSTAIVANISGVSRLPGVQSGDPDGNAKELPVSAAPVGGKPLDLASLDLDAKIGLLNALKGLSLHTPKIKADPPIQALVLRLYREWVAEIMGSVLTNNVSPELGSLTTEEIATLKTLARTILDRQSQAPAAAGKPVSMPGENPRPQSAAPMVPAKGLNPGVNTQAYRNAQAEFLGQLAKLEREGPEWLTRE